jgi:sterol desaturase/sphingolipid hydroxylase (fatty acid hydroxylase superfamily)
MLRLTLFFVLLSMLGVAEAIWPRHSAAPRRDQRWPVNLGLGCFNALCLKVLLPWLAVDAALWAHAKHFGLLPRLPIPSLLAALLAFAALDLVIYAQHRVMHRIPLLWRLHRMHHSDLALDVSSGVRFHPAEIVLSMGIKVVTVVLLGAAPAVVLIFEIVLSSFSLFTHANLALPVVVDRLIRRVFVTPDMHRIHHSVMHTEHDTNFGFHVSWWDRLFGTYRESPASGHSTVTLGLDDFRDPVQQRFSALLKQPIEARRAPLMAS